MVVGQNFINSLDLYQFKTIKKIKDSIEDFLASNIFKDIVRHHILALLNENKNIFKTFEQ